VAQRIDPGTDPDPLVAGYYTSDLIPIIRLWGLPTLDDGLDAAILAFAVREAADSELRAWIADNTGEIRDLAAWFALYEVTFSLFSRCPFVTTDLEDEVRTVTGHAVPGYAMAQADLIMCARTQRDLMLLATLHDLARARTELPPPPWDL
jgi:hypothetical protein